MSGFSARLDRLAGRLRRDDAAQDPVFVFPGQGSQWPGMALELIDESPIFARRMSECASAFEPHVEWSLFEVLRSPDHPLWGYPRFVQPAIFAIEASLLELWRSFGVEPGAVIGQSVGETAAALAAGALELDEAARLSTRWAVGQEEVGAGGTMAFVLIGAKELEPRLAALPLQIGGFVSPSISVVCGDGDAIKALLEELAEEDVWGRTIDAATGAAHVWLDHADYDQVSRRLTWIVPRSGAIPFYSTLTGDLYDTAGLDATYWMRNSCSPVQFEGAIRAAIRDGHRTFIEVAPNPVLGVPIQEVGGDAGAVALWTIRKGKAGMAGMRSSVAKAQERGVAPDMAEDLDPGGGRFEVATVAEGRAQAEEPSETAQAPGDDVAGELRTHLSSLPEAEQRRAVVDLIRSEIAALLEVGPEEIEPTVAFLDLGLESVAVAGLRDRLRLKSGVDLPTAAAFDFPTVESLGGHLHARLFDLERESVEPTRQAAAAVEEPVAIVGIGCRFPGGVSTGVDLWEMVAAGRDGVDPYPDDRGWDPDLYRVSDEAKYEGGFVRGAGDFDPVFFGMGPREALVTDPQHRLLLEGAWEALEDAGIDPSCLRGSGTGVFAGVSSQDYYGGPMRLLRNGADVEETAGQEMIGMLNSVLTGRVAYTLGLEGPAVTVDTACSSSLVAIHLASQALRSGECELALAGGVTVLATPGAFVGMRRQGGLAADGRCKSFAAAADGTGWAEGMGLLALERLSDAKANGRRILAVLKGSAVNQDGASNGLTAPNGPSQERVIRQALANAGLKPSEVDAVEAHGTGTTLGDPIEAQALLATYGQERESGPLALGSLKSNIGHAQAAAGVGGVIKMVMALEQEKLPPTLHVDEPTPHVDWSSGEVELLTEGKEWKRGERPRRAGISSFGLSGTNAHLILEEAPEAPIRELGEQPPAIPLALSAKTPEALAESALRLAAHIRKVGPNLTDVAHTLLASRASLPRRAVVVGKDDADLLEGLAALAAGRSAPDLATGKSTTGKSAWLLSGQGCQRPQMGTGLYGAFPVYAQALDRACAALSVEGVEAREAIFAEPGTELARTLDRTDLTQASLFATEVALHELLSSFGLSPDLLLGHSIGEITAVHLAGALSLADAAKLVAARGRLMAALPSGGAMASVRAGEEEVLESLTPFEGTLGLAALNAPASTVVSGSEEALERWLAEREAAGMKAKRLEVSHAFHSHLIEPMLGELEAVAATLELKPFEIPVISNLDGEELTAERAADPSYWAAQARSAVRFADGVAALCEQGATRFLEVGPDAVLTAIAAECLDGEDLVLAPALRREHEEPVSFVTALGAMHASGTEVDWKPLIGSPSAPPLRLPSYPFQRSRYWLEAKIAGGDPTSLGQGAAGHPFLGASIALAKEGEHLFTGRISLSSHAWLADHAVSGAVLLPGTAFLEMALMAGTEVGAEYLKELLLEAPLILVEKGAVDLRLSLCATDGEDFELEIHSRPASGDEEEELPWTRHAAGALSREEAPPPDFAATAWPPSGAEPVDVEELYDLLAAAGLEYGSAFQGMGDAWCLDGDVYAEVSLDEAQRAEAERFVLHPALLDAAGHAVLLAAGPFASLHLPFGFSGVRAREGATVSELRVRARLQDGRTEIAIADAQGRPVCAVDGISLREVDPASLRGSGGGGKDLFTLEWRAVSAADDPREEGEIELHRLGGPEDGEDPPAAARRLAGEALAAIQAFLAKEDAAPRLAILTDGAVAVSPEEAPDPALAAAWGLVRSAQAEHPGRFVLIDGDPSEAALKTATAIEGEPVLALREGKLLAPRLARSTASEEPDPFPFDPERTALITGGLSGLGALAARHVVERHGAKHMLLVGRRGADTPGTSELISELAAIGCEAKAVACDVSDKAQLKALLDSIGDEHPLGAVLHCAGVIDDALLSEQDSERLDAVLAPKADAAWHLHELTKDSGLTRFVLYSSVAGTLESPGQANYAAANAFLDALARCRRAEGMAGTAIAWGPWAEGMAADLDQAGSARRERLGLGDLDEDEGLELLDFALVRPEPALLAVRLLRAGLRRQAQAGALSPLFSELISVERKRSEGEGSLARKLAAASEEERLESMLEFVRGEVAGVLGRPSGQSIEPDQAFKDMGFDSLGAVELRNRFALETGVQLEATVVFDYPTSTAVARHLLDRMDLSPVAGGDPEQEEIRRLLEAIPLARLREAGVLDTLRSLSGAASADGDAGGEASEIDAMDVDELVKRTLEEPVAQEVEE